MKSVLFLGYTPDEHSEGNIGDSVINSGVRNIFASLYELNEYWHDRANISLENTPDNVDAVVYAGMPQFGSRRAPTLEERIWRSLLEKYPRASAYDVGCGTGYSCLDNRLEVAARMASARFNQVYYGQQSQVIFLARDPLSKHFLDFCGCNAQIALCPSAFSESAGGKANYDVSLIIATPDNKLNEHERKAIGFDLVDFYKEIVKKFPDILCIGQEHEDWATIEKIGAKNAVVENDLEKFMSACASARSCISFRVHGTVASLLAKRGVIHYAIDGRSDLLTPYMTCGLMKSSVFYRSIADCLLEIDDFHRLNQEISVDELKSKSLDKIYSIIKENKFDGSGFNSDKSIVVDANFIGSSGKGSIFIFTSKNFSSNLLDKTDRSLRGNVSDKEYLFYGLYRELPVGNYVVNFDFEFWGMLENQLDCDFKFEVISGGNVVERRAAKVASLLTSERIFKIAFTSAIDGAVLELRVASTQSIPGLVVEFFGVSIERER